VRLYGDNSHDERVKVFDNEDFGYYRIRVERPLRLNFKITDERIARLDDQRAFINLATSRKRNEADKQEEIEAGKEQKQGIKEVLNRMKSD